MQLTFVNFFKKTVPGHIFRGKRRLVRKVTFKDIQKSIDHFKLQEKNMSLLSMPYLSIDQSSGHAKELGKTSEKLKFWYDNKIKLPFKNHVKIEDRLNHVRHNENWE